jgi:hypothetical protein
MRMIALYHAQVVVCILLTKTKESLMQQASTRFNEPTLDELFEEPMIQLMMKRDGAARDSIERALMQLAALKTATEAVQ